jgi:hypothetical protein
LLEKEGDMIFSPLSPFRFLAAQVRRGWAWALDYNTLVTDEEWGFRRGKCANCEELVNGEQCRICTCFVDAKAYLAMEQCPKGKWKRIWRRKVNDLNRKK